MFIFGLSSQEVINFENHGGYNSMEIFNNDSNVREVLVQLVDGTYAKDNPERFRPLYNSLLYGENGSPADRYFILKDFESYADAQRRIVDAYKDQKGWAKMAMLNTASAGKFSSDRTIEEYVRDIWKLEKVYPVQEEPAPEKAAPAKKPAAKTPAAKKTAARKTAAKKD